MKAIAKLNMSLPDKFDIGGCMMMSVLSWLDGPPVPGYGIGRIIEQV